MPSVSTQWVFVLVSLLPLVEAGMTVLLLGVILSVTSIYTCLGVYA
ncbi:small integral membrane protein 30-like [Tenrec ecaudatus]